MELDLHGKVVLVTGGTDGLGAGLADRLVAEGAYVAICGRDIARLTAMSGRPGGAGLAVQADVTSAADMDRLLDQTLERWGRVDGLVNNAARSMGASFERFTEDDWREDIDLKLIAAVRLIRLCLPHLRASPAAAVVN